MKNANLFKVFGVVHGLVAAIFAIISLLLIGVAVHSGVTGLMEGFDEEAGLGLIEAMGFLAVAVVSLQISQTIAEEEVIREAHVSSPTRVRRFLSRFLVVVAVALSIEGLIGIFKALRQSPSDLPYSAAVVVAVAVLLAGWGFFIRCNREAEELEPEAMREAKSEDKKLKK